MQFTFVGSLSFIIGSLSTDDGDGNRNVRKSSIGLIGKKKTFHVHHTFLCISLPSLYHYHVKFPYVTFCWGRRHTRTNSLSTFNLAFCFHDFISRDIYMWHVKRVGILATKFDITRSPFKSYCNVLLPSPPSLLKLFNRKLRTLRSDGHANGNVAEK